MNAILLLIYFTSIAFYKCIARNKKILSSLYNLYESFPKKKLKKKENPRNHLCMANKKGARVFIKDGTHCFLVEKQLGHIAYDDLLRFQSTSINK